MKMHTICGRGKKKDFFEKKYGQSQFFYLWKSIQYFADADEDVDIRGLDKYDVSWEQVKQRITATCVL